MIKNNILKPIVESGLNELAFDGNFGLEKENLRITDDGKLAQTPHPAVFGNKLKNPYITVDFSESQIEMITKPMSSIELLYRELVDLNDSIIASLDNEYLWPQSIPPFIPCERCIPVAVFDDSEKGKESEKYRNMLAETYGKHLQLLSGIHFNFSFSDNFLKKLYNNIPTEVCFKEFKNQVYLKMSRNYIRDHWIVIFLLGASPVVYSSYFAKCLEDNCKCKLNLKVFNDGALYSNEAVSFRHGQCGYKNKEELYVSFNSIKKYVEDIEKYVREGKISSPREFYSPIRIKTRNPKDIIKSLKNDGIEYLEIRTIDINPYYRAGIDIRDLHFLHLFLIYCLVTDDYDITEEQNFTAINNHEVTAMHGRMERLHLNGYDGKPMHLRNTALKVITSINDFINKLGYNIEFYAEVLNYQKQKIIQNDLMYSTRLIGDIFKSSYLEFNLNKAIDSLNECRKRRVELDQIKHRFGIGN